MKSYCYSKKLLKGATISMETGVVIECTSNDATHDNTYTHSESTNTY